jgi:hypothetical protein
MDTKRRVLNENPELHTGWFFKLFYVWITPLFKLGKRISEHHLYKPIPTEESEYLTNELEK